MADVEGVIRERLAEIDTEKRQLEAALVELTGRQGESRRHSSTNRGSRSTRRAKPGERRRQVLAHLETNSGARPSEIATAINASPNQVHAIIAKLRKDRLVRRRGKGYGLASAAAPPTSAKRSQGSGRSKKAGRSGSSRQGAKA